MGVPGAWLPVEILISNIWRCRKEDDFETIFVRGKTLSIDSGFPHRSHVPKLSKNRLSTGSPGVTQPARKHIC